jgi:hypothetical protein
LVACPKCGAAGKTYLERDDFYKCGNCNANLILQGGELVLKSQTASYISKKVTSEVVGNIAEKNTSVLVGKTISNPAFIVGDVAETATRIAIKDPNNAEVVGSVVGLGSYVTIGIATGGPIGGIVGAGTYVGGRILGKVLGAFFN